MDNQQQTHLVQSAANEIPPVIKHSLSLEQIWQSQDMKVKIVIFLQEVKPLK